jgi:hypothetical protein
VTVARQKAGAQAKFTPEAAYRCHPGGGGNRTGNPHSIPDLIDELEDLFAGLLGEELGPGGFVTAANDIVDAIEDIGDLSDLDHLADILSDLLSLGPQLSQGLSDAELDALEEIIDAVLEQAVELVADAEIADWVPNEAAGSLGAWNQDTAQWDGGTHIYYVFERFGGAQGPTVSAYLDLVNSNWFAFKWGELDVNSDPIPLPSNTRLAADEELTIGLRYRIGNDTHHMLSDEFRVMFVPVAEFTIEWGDTFTDAVVQISFVEPGGATVTRDFAFNRTNVTHPGEARVRDEVTDESKGIIMISALTLVNFPDNGDGTGTLKVGTEGKTVRINVPTPGDIDLATIEVFEKGQNAAKWEFDLTSPDTAVSDMKIESRDYVIRFEKS